MQTLPLLLLAASLGAVGVLGCSRESALPTNPSAAMKPPSDPGGDLDALARQALSERADPVQRAAELRRHGRPAFEALLRQAEQMGVLGPDIDALLDGVAAQRYARYARLYWHTSLDEALAQARELDRPVLSLRLLGQLTEDLSCANSRFFRVVLYPDPAVRQLLEERFVLHWSSERPAPKVTVDYGDGRKLVRTVTGNSVHYVLDARGRVLDALPGLQDPASFRGALESGVSLFALGRLDDPDFAAALADHHGKAVDAVADAWRRELGAVGIDVPPTTRSVAQGPRVPARSAAVLAMSKALVERPLLDPLVPPEGTQQENDEEVWGKLGELRRPTSKLSQPSRRLIRELLPQVLDSEGRLTNLDERALEDMVDRFERILAVDTQKNRLLLTRRVHERLRDLPLEPFEDFNAWVYASLFETPREDPWLGLVEPGTFSALPREGIELPPRDAGRQLER